MSTIKDVLLPHLGEGIETAVVSEISVSLGDVIKPEDTILVLESDKATMEIPTEVGGVVKDISTEPGAEVKSGDLLIKVELSSDEETQVKADPKTKEGTVLDEKPAKIRHQEIILTPIKEDIKKEGVYASPGVRRLSRELGINLQFINGSGHKGRITKEDLHGYIKFQMSTSGGGIEPIAGEIDFSIWGTVEVQKLTKIKRITGQRLRQAWQSIPHVTQFDEADITLLEVLRKKLKEEHKKDGIKITMLPFLMKATVSALKAFPLFNGSLDHTGENIVIKKYFHIGVAVDTPAGLLVPVIRDVDQKSIVDISKELMDVSDRARNKKLKPDEMKGGTFTISNLGGIGGTFFTPIINSPEVAILGVSRSDYKQIKNGNKFESRLILPLSLSYDHRVIDGVAGATFMAKLSTVLGNLSSFNN